MCGRVGQYLQVLDHDRVLDLVVVQVGLDGAQTEGGHPDVHRAAHITGPHPDVQLTVQRSRGRG